MMSSNTNRRITMSGIPSHQRPSVPTNRRESLVPSTPMVPSDVRSKAKGRKSMIPRVGRENNYDGNNETGKEIKAAHQYSNGNPPSNEIPSRSDRRSSILPSALPGYPLTNKQEKDPRQVNEKQFHQKGVRDLLQFLIQSGYQYPLSQKSLSRPSAKDFSNIVTFMLRMIDPDFQHASNIKFEDEVALNFRCLGYPFTISKTALVAAGSAHTWPALLAALTWLMERLITNEHYLEEDVLNNPDGTDFDTMEELTDKSEIAFYQYLGKSYTAFLMEDTPELERMEVALSDRFAKDDEQLELSIERVTDFNASCVEKIQKLEFESAELPSYTKKREDYAIDLEQFHDLIRQMDEHKLNLEKKVLEKVTELTQINTRLEKMTSHVEDLKETVKSQDLSIDNAQRLAAEIEEVKESLGRYRAIKDQRMNNLHNHVKELDVVCGDIESIVFKYNFLLADLLNIHEMSHELISDKASFHKEKLILSDFRQIVGVDVKNRVRDGLSNCQKDFNDKYARVKEELHDELDRMEQRDEHTNACKAKLEIVVDKKLKSEQILESEIEATLSTFTIRQREVEAMEQKVNALRDPVAMEEQMAAFERQCSDLTRLRRNQQEEYKAKKNAVASEIFGACEAMKLHDLKVDGIVTQIHQYWEGKRDEVGILSYPSMT